MFNVGEIVRCIDDEGVALLHGHRYEIVRVWEDDDLVDVRDIHDDEDEVQYGFLAERFERVVDVAPVPIRPNINFNLNQADVNAIIENIPVPAAPVLKYGDGNIVAIGDYIDIGAHPNASYRVRGIVRNKITVRAFAHKEKEKEYEEYIPIDYIDEYEPSIFCKVDAWADPGSTWETNRFVWIAQEQTKIGYQKFIIIEAKNALDNKFVGKDKDVSLAMFTREFRAYAAPVKAEKKEVKLDMKELKKKLEEKVEKDRKEIVNYLKQGNIPVSAFKAYFVTPDAPDILKTTGSKQEPCHWNLKITGENWKQKAYKKATALAVYDFIGQIEQDGKAKAFAEWFVKKGPWRKAYGARPGWKNVFTKGLKMNIKRSGNEIASACIALRQAHEHPNTIASFSKFIEMGYSHEVAYLMSFCWKYEEEQDVWGNVNALCMGHVPFSGNINAQDLIKFLKHGLPDVPKCQAYATWPTYDNVDGVVGRTHANHNEQISTYMAINGQKEVGKGFNRYMVVTTEQVRELADKLTKDMANA